MPSISGIQSRLDRAALHLGELRREVRKVERQLRRHGVVHEHDIDTGDHLLVFAPPKELLTPQISLLAGDFVHNLRSVLDHIVWELSDPVIREQRPFPDFPISTPPGQGGNLPPRLAARIRSVPPDARIIIEQFQPYGGENQALRKLQQLDNVDKHRRLLTAPKVVSSIGLGAKPGTSFTLSSFRIDTGRFDHGDVVGRFAASNPEHQIRNVKLDFAFMISLDEDDISGGILDELSPLYEFVHDSVLPRFAPFFEPSP